jgi:PAS domain S-box-containing protein
MSINNTVQLQKEKELSDSIINSLPGIFYLFDYTGKFLRWNNRLETVSGYSGQEISGMKPTDFFDDPEKAYITSRIEKVFTEGISDAEANLFTRDGNKIPHYFTGQLITFEGKPCLTGMGIDISERKKVEKELEQILLKQELGKHKLVAQAMIEAQEKERAEIGKELHDNVNQILTTSKLYLELAKSNPRQRLKLIDHTAENINHVINEIRIISRALVPSSVGDLGLLDSIHDLIGNIRATKAIAVEFYSTGDFDETIGDQHKLMLFRIIQEQVNNVLKHSEAKNLIIELLLEEQEKMIELNIIDDGNGFDPSKTEKGVGFSNILSRASLFDGKVSIVSAPQEGCTLQVQLPYFNLNNPHNL